MFLGSISSSELTNTIRNNPNSGGLQFPMTFQNTAVVSIDDRYDSNNILDGTPIFPSTAMIPAHIRNKIKTSNDFPDGPQNPDILFNKLCAIESHRPTLKKDVKFMLKIFLVKYGVDCKNIKISANNALKYERLIDYYDLLNSKTLLTWTFPEVLYSLLKKYPTKFEFSDELVRDYKNFKIEYQNFGLISLLPKGGKYGGFVKVLLNLYLIQSGETEMNEMCLEAARVLFKSNLVTEAQRQEFFTNLKIDEIETAMWSAVFDKKFPKYIRVYKEFEQLA